LYAYNDLLRNEQSNAFTADYVRGKIAEIVKDPQVAERLTPRTYPIGTKRICIDSNYYETYNRPNVELVDISSTPIVGLTPSGLRTTAHEYQFDSLVFATGFDAVTGAVLNIEIRGRQGLTLREKWCSGARAYLGLAVAGFPNLFLINGPGSPSVLTNMVMSIQQNTDWIADCIVTLAERDSSYIEATGEAEAAWVDHVREVVAPTLYSKTDSWFLGANIPGKPRVFLPYIGGFANYAARCDQVARNGYEGFRIGSG
jgi:cyclohexanone monooxygenase